MVTPANKYLKIITGNSLIHASSRRLPLLAVSCIFFGYNQILKKNAGYSYGTIGALGTGDSSSFLINEDKVGNLAGKFIMQKKARIFIRQRVLEFKKYRVQVLKMKRDKNYFRSLEAILQIYPIILSHIGFYQSVMRYVKNNESRAKSLGVMAAFVVKDKDVVANLIYTQIEPLLNRCVIAVGKKYGIDGDLLRYMTREEFKIYLQNRTVTKKLLVTLQQRREGYIYLYKNGRDHIATNKAIINQIRRYFIGQGLQSNVLIGVSAYPGRVKGKVFRSFHGLKNGKSGYILVTNMTRPSDNIFLKKFIAIITDEGGVLSHASIMARELKIPCVMSTKFATRLFKDGDRVEVDASHGKVRKL